MREAEIVKEMEKRYPDAEISIQEVVKAGETKRGLTIREAGCNVAPNIYLRDFEKFTVEEACDEIQRIYEQYKPSKGIDISWYTDFENVKDKVFVKLVNTERCAEYLEGKPSIPFLDLSIVFYVVITSDEIGKGSITVTEEHMKAWGVDANTLYDLAKNNMEIDTQDLGEFVAGFPAGKMQIVSNKERWNGAGVLPISLDMLKEKFGKFYILPSSIHEVICIPADGVEDKAYLDEMVRDTNRTMVEPSDQLADHAYYFNGECLEV